MIYAGDTFITGDDIADAVLVYARALAASGTAATIDIPIYHPEKGLSEVSLLIGPASQIAAEPVDIATAEIRDEALVTQIHDDARATEAPRAMIDDDDPRPTASFFDDTA